MSFDPEKFLVQFNKSIVRSVGSLERASTKIVAAYNQEKGLMMGFVADLDLMSGAFRRIKNVLASLFLPLKENASGFDKMLNSMTSWKGAWKHAIKPMGANLKDSIGWMKKATGQWWGRIKAGKSESRMNQRYLSDMSKKNLADKLSFENLKKFRTQRFPLGPKWNKELTETVGGTRRHPTSKWEYQKKLELDAKGQAKFEESRFPKGAKPAALLGTSPSKEMMESTQARFRKFLTKSTEEKPLPSFGAPAGMPTTKGGKLLPFERMKKFGHAIGNIGRIGFGQDLGKKGEAGRIDKLGKGATELDKIGGGKFLKGARFFNREVAKPIRQIASGGMGLGFQATMVMGLMQAFASLFTIFQPIMDVVGMLMERLSIGFMPIIMMVMDILTSEPVLAIIDMLATLLATVFKMFEPLVPIIIKLIEIALMPLMLIIETLLPIIEIMGMLFGVIFAVIEPIIDLIGGALKPVFEMLAKVIGILIILSLFPLMYAIYGVGLFIAALIQIFSFGTVQAISAWNNLMLPIIGALQSAGGTMIQSFQTGTDYVPRTGVYMLHQREAVLNPAQADAYRGGGYGNSVVNVYVDGGVWVQNMDDLADVIGKKLKVRRY